MCPVCCVGVVRCVLPAISVVVSFIFVKMSWWKGEDNAVILSLFVSLKKGRTGMMR